MTRKWWIRTRHSKFLKKVSRIVHKEMIFYFFFYILFMHNGPPRGPVFPAPLQVFSLSEVNVDQVRHTYPSYGTDAMWVIAWFPRVYAERAFGVGRHISQVGGCKGGNKRALPKPDVVRWILVPCSDCKHHLQLSLQSRLTLQPVDEHVMLLNISEVTGKTGMGI